MTVLHVETFSSSPYFHEKSSVNNIIDESMVKIKKGGKKLSSKLNTEYCYVEIYEKLISSTNLSPILWKIVGYNTPTH